MTRSKCLAIAFSSTRLLGLLGSFACSSSENGPTAEPPRTDLTPPTFTGHPGTATPAAKIRFAEMAPFVKFGPAVGDMKVGAHGTFGMFPAGASSPAHTHSQPYHAVVISGVMENPFGTESNPPKLDAGSYWFVPAGEQHVTRCVSKEPCLFFFHAKSPFDFAPVEGLLGARSAQAVALPHSDLEWSDVAPFVKMANAWGERTTGSHGTFGRLPGNASSPKHTHSGEYRAVVISGTVKNPFGNETDPPELGPGSYWDVAANSPHITKCVSSEPCLFYFYAASKFDFAPAK